MLEKLKRFVAYYLKADTIHNIHSPFVYDFIFDVLDTKKDYYAFNPIEYERRMLLSNNNEINIEDFGAGSKTANQNKKRSISSIAKNVVSNEKKCKILFNLVNKFQPNTTIELGTSLGISTFYMSKAKELNKIYTIEADLNVYKLAHLIFERNNLRNVSIINDTFDNALPPLLAKIDTLDLAFIDGNHSYEATIKYFNLLKNKCNSSSVIVLDDINWSEGMRKAWIQIKKDKDVVYTIDVFDLAFVFFDKSVGEKRDFTLIDFWKKPYRVGFWG